ncbi:hypothetical protein C0993_009374 [Termitomyces sp. T159_Od127]|nr:hypothetical protein C0993_009374 [Termitomyces sp. T159_Od127]
MTTLPKFLRAKDADDGPPRPRRPRLLARRPPDSPEIPAAAVAVPRARRTLTPSPPPSPPRISLYASTPAPSSGRLSDLPTRLSGWFSHTFSSSSTDLSLPALIASSSSHLPSPGSSPKRPVGPAALLAAARHGKDRAMRYLLDTDADDDGSPAPVWLLGVPHDGCEAAFYADFVSRIWLTYRSHFPPIRDIRLADLDADHPGPLPRRWAWPDKSWSSDSGWGCMLRTGQSLLANALVHLHLARDWRRPSHPHYTADYAAYVRILSWFLDSPAPEAPFSVHRMALAGKELGTDVGQWFGPSTAAGAIKTLVNAFPDAGLGVVVATDSVLFQTDVFGASHSASDALSLAAKRHHAASAWGDRPVLLLIGVRLGLDGVNPIYHDTIKMLYTFPQSVGIAGGRPSSSYYFVGSQADNLFYLDPHHTRPAIPLRLPPEDASDAGSSRRTDSDHGSHKRTPTPNSPSSTFSYHAPLSPSPLHQEYPSSPSLATRRFRSASPEPQLQPEPEPKSQPEPESQPNALGFTLAARPAPLLIDVRIDARPYPGALRDGVPPGRAQDVPLRARAQDAAERAGPEHAHRVRVPRRVRLGGLPAARV